MFAALLFAAALADAGDARCALASSAGVDPVDAQTAAELVCDEIGERPGRFRVRIARLEHKVVLTLTRAGEGGAVTERRLVLSGLDEVPTAAPRLVEALDEQKRVAETQTVENVVAEEAHKPKKKPGEVHAWLGIVTTTALRAEMPTRGGVELGMAIGSTSTVFVANARLVGESFAEPLAVAATIVSLGMLHDEHRKPADGAFGTGAIGVRQYLAKGDIGPFAGAGMGIGYLSMEHPSGARVSGSGVLPYAEVGVDVLRTSTLGGAIGLRLDVPTFPLAGDAHVRVDPAHVRVEHVKAHPALASVTAALRF